MAQNDPSDPAFALHLSQQASSILSKTASVRASFPLNLLNSVDSPELWADLEQVFYACLRAGDDKSAHLCLERLTQRFGRDNERVMGMRGMYQEAVAPDEAALSTILQDYNKILSENPMNVPVQKRRIAVVRAMGRPQEAIAALTDFLDSFPTDIEGWCELSDLYHSQGFGSQAIFCLEEALLAAPNAWNLHARLGELEYMIGRSSTEPADKLQKSLVQAIQRFSRSIELCDDYLRGYYGLKLATEKSLQLASNQKSSTIIPRETLQKLNDLATSKLKAIVQTNVSRTGLGLDRSEVIAAQELLDRSKS